MLLTNKLTTINKFIFGDFEVVDRFYEAWYKFLNFWNFYKKNKDLNVQALLLL